MAQATNGKRHGSQTRKNPRTKKERLARVAYLTKKIEEAKEASAERLEVMTTLWNEDEVSLREIAEAAGRSPQAIHKTLTRSSG